MTAFHQWPADTRVDESLHDRELCARLELPPGSIGFLRLAFALGLSRSTTWGNDSLPPPEQAAADAACRIFRRGASNTLGNAGFTPTPEYPPHISPLVQPDLFILADVNVARLWPDVGRAAHGVVEDGDYRKNLDSVASIRDAWIAHGRRPRWLVYGGGHTLDIAGFAAGLAGIHIHAVPTTLLAMVDASIGGKTGVNFPPWGKNQVGMFWHPERLSIWPGWLNTLDPSHWRGQSSECLKYAWIKGDPTLLTNIVAAIQSNTPTAWAPLIPHLVGVKHAIVLRDSFERGERTALNLGHTLGHALETLSEERVRHDPRRQFTHGEAVVAGMAFALGLSRLHANLDDGASNYLRGSLREAGLWPSPQRWKEAFGPERMDNPGTHHRLWELITHDKKRRGTDSEWVLLAGFGQVADNNKPGTYLTALARDQVMSELEAFTRGYLSPEYP